MEKFCIAIFPLNALQNQQKKMDHAKILHFNLEIEMQKFCIAIFLLHSLKNQQQIDNAEILHLNFDTYNIWMQKFCRASFRQIHYKNNITKLVSKCAGGINEQLLKTSGFDVLSPRKKLQKTLGGGGGGRIPRCKLQPGKKAVSTERPSLRTYRRELATENGKTSKAARSEKRRPF